MGILFWLTLFFFLFAEWLAYYKRPLYTLLLFFTAGVCLFCFFVWTNCAFCFAAGGIYSECGLWLHSKSSHLLADDLNRSIFLSARGIKKVFYGDLTDYSETKRRLFFYLFLFIYTLSVSKHTSGNLRHDLVGNRFSFIPHVYRYWYTITWPWWVTPITLSEETRKDKRNRKEIIVILNNQFFSVVSSILPCKVMPPSSCQ